MTETYFPFDSGNGASVMESQWSQMARFWLSTGVLKGQLNELQAYADSSAMTVKVKSGQAWIMGHFYQTDSEISLPIAVSDPSQARIDRVVCRVDWVNNNIGLHVLQGIVGGAEPALTQNTAMWEIPICKVNVRAGEVTVAAGDVTDERSFTGFPQSITAIANSIALRDANGDLTANEFHGTADNSNGLGGQAPSYYLPATAQASDSAKLGGQSPSYYATASQANSSTSGTWTPAAGTFSGAGPFNIASVPSGARLIMVSVTSGNTSLVNANDGQSMWGASDSSGSILFLLKTSGNLVIPFTVSSPGANPSPAYIFEFFDGSYYGRGYFQINNGYLQFVNWAGGLSNTSAANTIKWAVA